MGTCSISWITAVHWILIRSGSGSRTEPRDLGLLVWCSLDPQVQASHQYTHQGKLGSDQEICTADLGPTRSTGPGFICQNTPDASADLGWILDQARSLECQAASPSGTTKKLIVLVEPFFSIPELIPY